MKPVVDHALVNDFLACHLAFRPVDATFMGIAGYDHALPRADAAAAADEAQALAGLATRASTRFEPATVGDRLDLRLLRAEIAVARANLENRPRYLNPAWYTGEAAFGVIGLLLPQSEPVRAESALARLTAIPDYFADGRARLAGAATPRGWVARAQREAAAFARFLNDDLRRHPAWDTAWADPARSAAAALAEFAEAIADLPDRDPACGSAHLTLLMREAHGLELSPEQAARKAAMAFDKLGEELTEMAARIDRMHTWQQQIDLLADIHPPIDGVARQYDDWQSRAIDTARNLVTPAEDYGLEYRIMAPAFQDVAKDLYFLFYRSPPAQRAGHQSVYWVGAEAGDRETYLRSQNTAFVKTVHVVHHGSIGHHTQNARARAAQSRLARLAGTDCASAIAFLSAGTMVEGWACYAEDLLMETDGFYTPGEILLLKQFERRNAASVLVDIRLHTGEWSLHEAKAFYRDKAGFAPARVDNEVVRNSIYPATRLMYWLGVETIKELRSRYRGTARSFHDTLIGYGHVPVRWAGDEMIRAGMMGG